MKKVLLLLITILCLVSCRTATVSSPLEIEIVPSSSSTNVESPEVQETLQPPTLIDEPDIEPILNDKVPAQITGLFEPGTDVEPKIETSSEVAEENASTINSDEIIEDDKEILSEQEDVSETTPQEESTRDVSESPNAPSNEEVQKTVTTVVSAKEDKSSLIDKLISVFLKEKLFWFGVFTIIVGIIMLIIVFMRDMINACRRRSNKKGKKLSTKKGKCKSEKSQDVSSEEKQEELSSSNTSFDDDEAFLRSLLNT